MRAIIVAIKMSDPTITAPYGFAKMTEAPNFDSNVIVIGPLLYFLGY